MATNTGNWNYDGYFGGFLKGSVNFSYDFNFTDNDTLHVSNLKVQNASTTPEHHGAGFYDGFGLRVYQDGNLPSEENVTQPEPESVANEWINHANNGDYGLRYMMLHNNLAPENSSRYKSGGNKQSWDVHRQADGKFYILQSMFRNLQGSTGHWQIAGDGSNISFPQYIPMSIRKGSVFQSLNTHNGFIKIRKGGKWVDKSYEEIATDKHENTGHNRIRKNGKWLQQSEIGN